MPLFPQREPTGVWWRDHSLTIVLSFLLVAQTLYALWTGHHVYAAEQLSVPFWIWWSHEYNTSLVADTYGVWLVVVLTIRFRERNSSQG